MAFQLQVEFAGLCKYLIHPAKDEVAVLMPDGRRRLTGTPVDSDDAQKCREHLVYHAGYLRYNLANAIWHVPERSEYDGPAYEVIHRFNFEELDFGLGFDERLCDVEKICVAELSGFAPRASIRDGMFDKAPPAELLMRTVLRGGRFSSRPLGRANFNTALNRHGAAYCGSFAGSVRWTRHIADDQLVLRIRSWDGTVKQRIRLRPVGRDRVVKLKVANLCAENPLEWRELFLRVASGVPDRDFKWFYKLWQDSDGPFSDILDANPPLLQTLPIPIPDPVHGDVTNCGGSRQTAVFDAREFSDE